MDVVERGHLQRPHRRAGVGSERVAVDEGQVVEGHAAAAGQEREAREAELQAMRVLGYERAFTRCRSFSWRKIEISVKRPSGPMS